MAGNSPFVVFLLRKMGLLVKLCNSALCSTRRPIRSHEWCRFLFGCFKPFCCLASSSPLQSNLFVVSIEVVAYVSAGF